MAIDYSTWDWDSIVETDQFKESLETAFKANPLQVLSAGVQNINEEYQQELGSLASSGKYDRQSEIRQAGSGLRVDAANEVKGLMQDLGLNEKDLRQNVSGSSNDLFMDLGVGNLALHDVADINIGTATQLPNYRDLAAQGGELQTTSDQMGGFTVAERVDQELDKQALGMIASLAVPYAVGPGGLGLTGIYGGAGAAAAGTAAQQAIQGDIDVEEILKSGALGGLTAAGTDLIKDAVSQAVERTDNLRATTSDLGGLIGEKGLLSGIPELNVEGLRDFTSDVGDFFFGPSANTEWVQMADGTKVYPDPKTGLVTLPDGTVAPMNTIQNNVGSFEGVQDTFMREAGKGGILSSLNPALDSFNTAFTPIADNLATFLVGDNPWHDERLTLDERLNAERSADAMSQSIFRSLPIGMQGSLPQSEEEAAASQPIVVGPETAPREAEEVVEDLEEGDGELILGTGDGLLGDSTGEEIPQEEETEVGTGPTGTTGGGDGELVEGDSTNYFPEGGDVFPKGDQKTIFTDEDDEVEKKQKIVEEDPSGGGGGGSTVAARARQRLKEGDPEMFRLARIMQIEGLPASVYEATMARIQGLVGGSEGADYGGDVTGTVDPLSGRYIKKVKGKKGETRRKAMLRELKEKEVTE